MLHPSCWSRSRILSGRTRFLDLPSIRRSPEGARRGVARTESAGDPAFRKAQPFRATLLAGFVLAACGDGERAAVDGPFCAEVSEAVERFVGEEDRGGIAGGAVRGDESDRYGGTVVVGSNQELRDGMHALTATHDRSVQHQLHLLLLPLLRRGPDLEPRPGIASAWHSSPQGDTLRFRIRTDLSWHDGVPVTSGDVAFTLRRILEPATGSSVAYLFEAYPEDGSGIQVPDDSTLVLLRAPGGEPWGPWMDVAVLPEHLLGDVPPDELAQHPFGTRCPVGNGPFVFVEHRTDERWVFRANPHFPEELGGRPYLDRYVLRVIPEASTLLTELLTGGIAIYPRLPADYVRRVREDPGLEVLSTPGRSMLYVAWNGRRAPLDDARVRRALGAAIDRQAILEGIRGGHGRVAETAVPPYHRGWMPASGQEDPGALLDAAGWVRGGSGGPRMNDAGETLSFTLLVDGRSAEQGDVAQRIQSDLAKIGVGVEIRALELGTLLSIAEEAGRDFDAILMSTQLGFAFDDRVLFHSSEAEAGVYAWAGTTDPELDLLLDSLSVLADFEEAEPYWHRYQARLREVAPYAWLYVPDWLMGVSERIRGIEVDVRGEWAGIGEWWIPSEARR